VLALLSENPSNGYQLIQQISQRSGGVWEPSPGSIYPALQLLQDEGLVTASESDGKRLFSLTDAGRTYAEERRTELNAVWDTVSGTVDNSTAELRNLIKQVAIAVMQVAGTGTEPQVAEARRLLTQTRRQLYGILAAEEPTSTAQSGGEPESV
jgi:DNA-binding PadR family transcriptional regulator